MPPKLGLRKGASAEVGEDRGLLVGGTRPLGRSDGTTVLRWKPAAFLSSRASLESTISTLREHALK